MPAMPAIDIPARCHRDHPASQVIKFLDEQHLEELGDTGQVARTWRWGPARR